MDLYNPLYVNRPTVEPELFASLRPVTYRGAFGKRETGDGRRDLDDAEAQTAAGRPMPAARLSSAAPASPGGARRRAMPRAGAGSADAA